VTLPALPLKPLKEKRDAEIRQLSEAVEKAKEANSQAHAAFEQVLVGLTEAGIDVRAIKSNLLELARASVIASGVIQQPAVRRGRKPGSGKKTADGVTQAAANAQPPAPPQSETGTVDPANDGTQIDGGNAEEGENLASTLRDGLVGDTDVAA
jgi:hypothetical protein